MLYEKYQRDMWQSIPVRVDSPPQKFLTLQSTAYVRGKIMNIAIIIFGIIPGLINYLRK